MAEKISSKILRLEKSFTSEQIKNNQLRDEIKNYKDLVEGFCQYLITTGHAANRKQAIKAARDLQDMFREEQLCFNFD